MSTDGSEMVSYLYETLKARHKTIKDNLNYFE